MDTIEQSVTIERFIEQFLAAVDFQDPVELAADTKLESLPEWDSLSALATIVLFDTEYGKVIVGNDIAKCVTVSDLYALLG
jgi:acyl carrier protein